ncbi:MAG: M50 family metallopeptidase [Cyanophyceae cyanobacterium]
MDELERLNQELNSPEPQSPIQDANDHFGPFWLVGAAVVTVVLWQFSWGDRVLYPFSLLATWFHEMGHGLTAMALGGDFLRLEIFPNGSGFAVHRGSLFLGPLGRALVAAGGPMGPPIAGGLLILAGQRLKTTQWSLWILSVALVGSALIWVRSPFGILLLVALGIPIGLIARYSPRWIQVLTVQFLGVQACISTYHQVDYLFSPGAVIGGQQMLSDSAQIAQNLLLPYWFWGGLMAIASLAILAQTLYWAYRKA